MYIQYNGGFCLGGFCPGGFCPGGFCPGGILSRGFCPGGFCPGDFVLEPVPGWSDFHAVVRSKVSSLTEIGYASFIPYSVKDPYTVFTCLKSLQNSFTAHLQQKILLLLLMKICTLLRNRFSRQFRYSLMVLLFVLAGFIGQRIFLAQ